MSTAAIRTNDRAAGLRRSLLRAAALGGRCLRHPTWALAHVQNHLDRRHDRRFATVSPPRGDCTLTEALRVISGADAAAIAAVLAAVPRPVLRRGSVLYGDPNASGELVALVYACCRLLAPATVVETGVANGYTTAAILRALAENERGDLLSIDLPHLHPRAHDSIGAAVDPALRGRWRLQLGPAARLLPVVADGRSVDIFVQDASHTTRGQLAEYRAGWPLLREGGLLISDDVGPGFVTFAAEVGHRPIYVDQEPKYAPIGLLVKRGVRSVP